MCNVDRLDAYNFLRDRTINYSAQLFSAIGIHCRLENFNYCPQNLQLASRLWPVDSRFVSGMYRRCAYVFVTIMRRLQSIHRSVYTGCFWNTHPTKLYKLFRSQQIAMGWKFHKRLRVWSFGANFHYRSLALLSRCISSLRPKIIQVASDLSALDSIRTSGWIVVRRSIFVL